MSKKKKWWDEFQLASAEKPAYVGPEGSMSVSVNGLKC